jgi:uncharacterized OB-fold protein
MSQVFEESALPVPLPVINPDTAVFWAATAEGRLLVTHCDACGENIWYPRPLCPFCHSTETSWLESAGIGTIYSFSVMRRGVGDWAKVVPYVIAYVELTEGPRVMTNIVESDVDRVSIGDPVEVVFYRAGDEAALPRFRRVQGE